jgi:hypothetical protein
MANNPNDTYVGPAIDSEGRPSTTTPGGVYVAIGVAILAVVLAFVGIWVGTSADSKAETTNARVTKLQDETTAAWQKQFKWNDATAAELAAQSTRTDELEVAVDKLQTKAEQKLVDQLILEMKDKESVTRVNELASGLLLKADKKSVDRIVRRMGGMTKRVNNLVELNKLIEVAPVAAPAPAPAPADPVSPPPAEAPKVPAAPPAAKVIQKTTAIMPMVPGAKAQGAPGPLYTRNSPMEH